MLPNTQKGNDPKLHFALLLTANAIPLIHVHHSCVYSVSGSKVWRVVPIVAEIQE